MMKSTAEIWTMIASEFSLRCAFALFHFLWQGTLLGIVAAVAMALLRNESASVRYWLSATGLFVCPLCVAATFCSMSPPRETHYRMNSVVAGQLASNAAGATNNSKETIVSRDNFELLVTDSNPEQSVSVFQTEKFLSVAFENLNLLLSKFSNFVLCIYAICVLALLLRLGTAIFGNFTILHCNIRRFISHWAELEGQVQLAHALPSVICLNETFFDESTFGCTIMAGWTSHFV